VIFNSIRRTQCPNVDVKIVNVMVVVWIAAAVIVKNLGECYGTKTCVV